MEDKEIFILGVGHNTIVYIDLAEACGYHVTGLFHYNDDRTGETIHGYPILDSDDHLFGRDTLEGMNFAISVGDNEIRSSLANKIRSKGGNLPKLIHPTSIVSRYSKISESVVVHANSVIQGDVVIEKDTVISFNVSITHTSKIGKSCYLAANSVVGAYIEIKDFAFIGITAVLVSGKLNYIGNHAIIGAGSIVIHDVESFTVVAGNPARVIKKLI